MIRVKCATIKYYFINYKLCSIKGTLNCVGRKLIKVKLWNEIGCDLPFSMMSCLFYKAHNSTTFPSSLPLSILPSTLDPYRKIKEENK